MAWSLKREKIPRGYIIDDYVNDGPYLSRLVFWRIFGVRILLHRFHVSDQDRALHNHPWKWAFSLILAGSYTEERMINKEDFLKGKGKLPNLWTQTKRKRWFNFLTDKDYHRVEELHGEVWTLFFCGPRKQDWGFLVDGEHIPHEVYLAEHSDGNVSKEAAIQP